MINSKIIKEMKTIELRADIPAFLKRNCLNRNLCEVGVRFAYHLQALLSADPDLLVGVDHYATSRREEEQDTGMSQSRLDAEYGKVFQRFLHIPQVKIYRGISKRAVGFFPPLFFDFVYIDADHSYEGSYQDMCLWWQHVRQGGIMAGHDFIETKSEVGTEFGVVRAVKRFMKERKTQVECFHHTKESHRTWMIYKIDGE